MKRYSVVPCLQRLYQNYPHWCNIQNSCMILSTFILLLSHLKNAKLLGIGKPVEVRALSSSSNISPLKFGRRLSCQPPRIVHACSRHCSVKSIQKGLFLFRILWILHSTPFEYQSLCNPHVAIFQSLERRKRFRWQHYWIDHVKRVSKSLIFLSGLASKLEMVQ